MAKGQPLWPARAMREMVERGHVARFVVRRTDATEAGFDNAHAVERTGGK